jgi:mRNA interferase MazF
VNRGDIRYYTFKAPDKRRPVLILSRDSVIPYLAEVTIAPITSRVRNIPSEVFLSKTDGLEKDCAVNCDHIQTVQQAKIGKLVAKLSSAKMHEIKQACMFALGFD